MEEIILKNKKHGMSVLLITIAVYILAIAGVIAGAGIDVQVKEPMAADNPLLTAPHCILTPHIAWAPFETRVRLIDRVAENLSAFQNGSPINTVI